MRTLKHMVVIRLTRGGAKKRPFYHVVATDKRNRRDGGNYIERLGYFNPIANGQELRLNLNRERIAYWMGVGAAPSHRMVALLAEWDKKAS
jgi:small subunit ribosomal protein S16